MKKILKYLCLSIFVLLGVTFSYTFLFINGVKDVSYYDNSYATKLEMSSCPGRCSVLILGGSNFANWSNVEGAFGDRSVINLSFPGAHLSHVEKNIDLILRQTRPDTIIFSLGAGDVTFSSKDALSASMEAQTLLTAISKRFPEGNIKVVSIVPSNLYEMNNISEYEAANRNIQAWAAVTDNAEFLDLFSFLKVGNSMDDSTLLSENGLMLSQASYQKFASLLKSSSI